MSEYTNGVEFVPVSILRTTRDGRNVAEGPEGCRPGTSGDAPRGRTDLVSD